MDDASKIKTFNEQELIKFVTDLVDEKASEYVTKENRQEVVNNLLKSLSDAINAKLVSKLNDSQIDEVNKLLDSQVSDEELSNYFGKTIPNLQDVIAEVLIDFRKGYLSVKFNEATDPIPAPPSPVN